MKKSLFYPVVLLLLCGCASSDRMVRMSGGIIEEYSAPKNIRLRSEKYQAKTKALSSEKKISNAKVAGLDDTLVNIWPFFFAANSYWSVLWPMIDCDDYGFAVRPFINKEGDDWSVLFPLSAWNTADKSGWVANVVWKKNGFGFIPLTWQTREKEHQLYYYTPLFYSEFNQRKRSFIFNRRTDHIVFCCLAYAQQKTFSNYDSSPHGWLFSYCGTNEEFTNEWRYRYRAGGAPGEMPKNEKELKKLKSSIFDTLKVEQENTWGFAPLWHYTSDSQNCYNWRLLLGLAGTEKTQTSYNWQYAMFFGRESTFGNPFASRYPDIQKSSWAREFPILFHIEEKQYYDDKPGTLYHKFNKLSHNSYDEPFTAALPRLTKQLKEIDPNAKIPQEVKDWNTFYLFRKELAEKREFAAVSDKKAAVIGPVFFYDSTPEKKSWFSLLLMSGAEKNQKESRLVIIPLMTFSHQAKDDGSLAIFAPIGYWNNYQHKERIDKKIYTSDTKWGDEHNVVSEENQYALLGLFYRGRQAFTVAKEGIDGKKAEFIRKELLLLSGKFNRLKKRRDSLVEKRKNVEEWVPANKIEYYKKMIRFEELKLEEADIDKDEKKYIASREKIKQDTKSLGLEISDSCFNNRKEAEKFLQTLFDKTTELRWKEDIGNGIFFRKEKFYNGDCNWHFLGPVARGEKNGKEESSSILHLLYRHRKSGERSETLFFPFVSLVKDGKDHRTSFLWRVFSIGERNGKTGGYILFIPFGEKI